MILKYNKFNESKNIGRVVITGAPGSGKSSVIDQIKKMGYVVIEEPAREIISYLQINDPDNLPSKNRDGFQKMVEDRCISDFKKNKSGFFDRSLVDEIGFRLYYKMEIPQYLKEYCNLYRYDIVFIFPPWKEIFKNDSVRHETFEQSLGINESLLNGYKSCGYNPISVPKDSIENRVEFILSNVK